jgi:hypothetical protein
VIAVGAAGFYDGEGFGEIGCEFGHSSNDKGKFEISYLISRAYQLHLKRSRRPLAALRVASQGVVCGVIAPQRVK